mmetsp:Transcript_27301/g.44464  ORF Transcript_27301/g.44464 Transcript_27301/m.44464 type:complete len:727 (-) Transcript_27301:204-2384(-)|eukprot:CAMPEP_0184647038 /NCGR_PEP_ID=MMETSP0308-20130426/3923_1 /TAXON_ID=38269 /ORGANISM="Gloeochaete witrockiana, Strain SAG 46.84" /LENGTH=726 /DNA_ID=CAMNT_0027077693 /DNA_START=46 /DNA_END=2226 /DNA_ORIENTATION=+
MHFTFSRFPLNGEVKEATGLPWACILQPLDSSALPPGSSPSELPSVEEIGRCKKCFAYINRNAVFERRKWKCSLCGQGNTITERYANQSIRTKLAELNDPVYEIELPITPEDENQPLQELANQGPIFVAVVDLTGSEEFLELVKSGLLAALEGVPPYAKFCLVTFSDRIGVYDLQSSKAHVRHVSAPRDSTTGHLTLPDILPTSRMLAQIGTQKDNITYALDTLRPVPVGFGSETVVRRGLGPAVVCLVDLLSALDSSIPVRVTVFLSGIPTYGVGALDPKRIESPADSGDNLLLEATPFYRQQAERIAVLGACVDLYVVSRDYVDLASIHPLADLTGGAVRLYDPEHTTLPPDLYRSVSSVCGYDGEIRIRTGPELRIGKAYGPITPHLRYENVYRLAACYSHTALSIDLDFNSSSGFKDMKEREPCVQMAYAYTAIVTKPAIKGDPSDLNNTTSSVAQCTVQRRLRIQTVVFAVALTPEELYGVVDVTSMMTVLAHKVIEAALDSGIAEGRLLLEDWLVLLTARYNQVINPSLLKGPVDPSRLDVGLSTFPSISALPRLVYLLLCHRMLQMSGMSPDLMTVLLSLFSSFEPKVIGQMIMPYVYGYTNPDTRSLVGIPLSRDGFTSSGAAIFLIDAWTDIVVYYSPSAAEMPFPPPITSALRKHINDCRQDRQITPHVTMARAGTAEAQQLDADWMLEDQTVTRLGLPRFFQNIAENVAKYLNSQ